MWHEGMRHKPYKDSGDALTVCYCHTGKDVISDKRYKD
ncbi:MAG: glycoside hydrolase family protein [Arsenophonus sp. NEOnobi-MAG3]